MPATLSVKSFYLDTPLRKSMKHPSRTVSAESRRLQMGKLWWFTMFVIVCVIFPVVAVITIGIMLAFIMGGSAL